jgi:glutamate-1-semialdehyde 2,1-aminomutase
MQTATYTDFLRQAVHGCSGAISSLQEKVIELHRESGPDSCLFHEYEYKLAKLISDPCLQLSVRMLAPVLKALWQPSVRRRTITEKAKVIKNGGGTMAGVIRWLRHGNPRLRNLEAHGSLQAHIGHTGFIQTKLKHSIRYLKNNEAAAEPRR